jgi:7-cyano-7-deazaguanine synthase in queuosine biosynthesis
MRSLVREDNAVDDILRLLTLYFVPHEVLLNMGIKFDCTLSAEAVTQAIDRLDSIIRSHYPDIRNIFVEAKSLTVGMSTNLLSRVGNFQTIGQPILHLV